MILLRFHLRSGKFDQFRDVRNLHLRKRLNDASQILLQKVVVKGCKVSTDDGIVAEFCCGERRVGKGENPSPRMTPTFPVVGQGLLKFLQRSMLMRHSYGPQGFDVTSLVPECNLSADNGVHVLGLSVGTVSKCKNVP